jgi:hypothetical protein
MSFIFRIPNERIPMSFISVFLVKGFLCPLFSVFLMQGFLCPLSTNLKMPENLKNIPKNLENLYKLKVNKSSLFSIVVRFSLRFCLLFPVITFCRLAPIYTNSAYTFMRHATYPDVVFASVFCNLFSERADILIVMSNHNGKFSYRYRPNPSAPVRSGATCGSEAVSSSPVKILRSAGLKKVMSFKKKKNRYCVTTSMLVALDKKINQTDNLHPCQYT